MQNNIAFYRTKKGLNQKQLADLLDVRTATISRWENGVINIPASRINALCKILETTPDLLMNFDEEKNKINQVFENISNTTIDSISNSINDKNKDSENIEKILDILSNRSTINSKNSNTINEINDILDKMTEEQLKQYLDYGHFLVSKNNQ